MTPRLVPLALLGALVIALLSGLPNGRARENELLTRLSHDPIALRFGLQGPASATRLYHLESTPSVELYWALENSTERGKRSIPVHQGATPAQSG